VLRRYLAAILKPNTGVGALQVVLASSVPGMHCVFRGVGTHRKLLLWEVQAKVGIRL
jgi:hypothetical protein